MTETRREKRLRKNAEVRAANKKRLATLPPRKPMPDVPMRPR